MVGGLAAYHRELVNVISTPNISGLIAKGGHHGLHIAYLLIGSINWTCDTCKSTPKLSDL